MRTAALIENGVVNNIIVIADGAEGDETLKAFANAVEITDQDVRITDKYDSKTGFTRVFTDEEIELKKAYELHVKNREAAKSKLLAIGLTEQEMAALGF